MNGQILLTIMLVNSLEISRKLPACILKATNNKKFAEKENFQTKEIL